MFALSCIVMELCKHFSPFHPPTLDWFATLVTLRGKVTELCYMLRLQTERDHMIVLSLMEQCTQELACHGHAITKGPVALSTYTLQNIPWKYGIICRLAERRHGRWWALSLFARHGAQNSRLFKNYIYTVRSMRTSNDFKSVLCSMSNQPYIYEHLYPSKDKWQANCVCSTSHFSHRPHAKCVFSH